jgi:hypothetical protein
MRIEARSFEKVAIKIFLASTCEFPEVSTLRVLTYPEVRVIGGL